MKTLLCWVVMGMVGMVGMVGAVDKPEPHLFYSPSGKIRLELTQKLPKEFRLCATGKEFEFCSPWQHPKTRVVEIELAIPANTPDGEYGLFYDDHKTRIELHHTFRVER